MRRLALLAILLTGCAGNEKEQAPQPQTNGDIVFASKRDGDFDVYVMAADGGDARNLTRNRAAGRNEADDNEPAVSPDGATIAFTSTRDHLGDGDEARDIYVMDVDGANVRRLTKNNASERNIDWMPDGRIVFWRCQGGVFGCSLIAIDADGSDEETLFRAGNGVSGLSVSPDGTRVAFNRWDPNSSTTNVEVVVADLDGRRERALTTGQAIDGDPEWSPDGSKLVFSSDRDRNGKCLFHDCTGWAAELYVMNADGSGQRRLTDDPGYDVFGTWSPDGTQILFARIADDTDDYELYVVDSDGGDAEQLTDNEQWDWQPDWTAAR